MASAVLEDPRRIRAALFMVAPIDPVAWIRVEAPRLGYPDPLVTDKEIALAQEWMDDRGDWPAYFPDSLAGHEPAKLYLASSARKRVLCANRRAAKTSTVGMVDAANLISQDDYFTLVLCSDLAEYDRNWLGRKPHGLLVMLADAGLRRGRLPDLEAGRADYAVWRTGGRGAIRAIEFAWGSRIEVFSDAESARGSAPNHLIIDEAQKIDEAANALLADIGPASADRRMLVTLAGTPGHHIDTTFGRIATGRRIEPSDLPVHDPVLAELLSSAAWKDFTWFSWNNPFFGATFAERYQAHVIDTAFFLAEQYGLTADQGEFIRYLTADLAPRILEDDRSKALHPDLLRELFGAWIREARKMVYALSLELNHNPFWGTWSKRITTEATGGATLDHLLAAPDRWPARLEALPMDTGKFENFRQPWRASIGVDPGYGDPFGLSLAVTSIHDPCEYELDSAKAPGLGEDAMKAILLAWVNACLALDIPVDVVAMDTGGGAAKNIQVAWRAKFEELFGTDENGKPLIPVVPAEKHESSIETQMSLINGSIRLGRKKYLRNSPLALELTYLEWRYPEEGKEGRRKQHKKRIVALPNGLRVELGNDCADADRYRYYYSTHVHGRPVKAPVRLTPALRLERSARASMTGGRRISHLGFGD